MMMMMRVVSAGNMSVTTARGTNYSVEVRYIVVYVTTDDVGFSELEGSGNQK